MNKKYFFRTALSLLLAFAMTFAPVMSSYAVMVSAITGEQTAVAEDNTGAPESDSDESADQSGAVAPDSNAGATEDTGADQDSEAAEATNQKTSDAKQEEAENRSDAETPAEKSATVSDEQKETEAAAGKAEDAEETKDTKDTYVYEDSKVKVTAVLKDPSAVPDDAKLVVVPVEKDSQEYNYDAYMDALNEDSDSEYSDNNTLLYDIAFIKDGVEIQPAKGNVSVSFEFLDSQLSESLGANKAADVNVIHLPLTDTAKEKYDTTADAKDISAGDIKVEEVNAAVNVDSEKVSFNTDDFSVYAYTVDFEYGEYKFSIPGQGSIKLSEVFEQLHIDKDVKDVENVTFSDPELVEVKKNLIGSNWTLTSKKAFSTEETLTVEMNNGETIEIKVTDAQERTAKINLFEDDGTTLATDTGLDSSKAYCLVARLSDTKGTETTEDDEIIAYQYVWINAADFQGYEWQYNDDQFKKLDNSGNVAYDESANHSISMRVYEGASWDSWRTNYNSIIELPDHVSGYIPLGSDTAGNVITVKFRKGFPPEYQVQVDVDSSISPEELAGLTLYAEAKHASTGTDTYTDTLPTESTTIVLYDPNRNPASTWTENPGGGFTGNEATRAYVKDSNGNEIPSGSIINGLVFNYTKRSEFEDDSVHETRFTDHINIIRMDDWEDAKDPYDVLGEGAEYGIIANKYIQRDHTETNFAAKVYENPKNKNIEIDGSGNGAMPFYVGEINDHLWLSGANNVDLDIYVNEDYSSVNRGHQGDGVAEYIWDTTPNNVDLTVYPLSQAQVNAKVDQLIDYFKDQSAEMAKKPSLALNFGNGRTVDTTSYPDDKTIYIDASNLDFAADGWKIRKLPGQTIVFNIPGQDPVTIREFKVVVVNSDGTEKTVSSNSGGNGGYSEDLENEILDHIVFNAYETKLLEPKSGPAGIFLAPNGNAIENSGSGTGWIATGGTFDQVGAEWHFFRTKRKYKAKGDFSLSGQKKIIDINTEEEQDYSKFNSMTFTFDLYECDEHGVVAADAQPEETVTADEEGKIEFSKLKYDQTKVPEGETRTFYYKIIERVHAPENGVTYNAAPVYVKVVAKDEAGSEIISFEISKRSDTETWKPVQNTGTDADKVYKIGDFKNTYEEESGGLRIKKTVTENGEAPSAEAKAILVGNYEFTLYTDKDCKNAYTVDGNAVTVKLTIKEDGKPVTSDEVTNLPAGDYWIKETSPNNGSSPVTNPVKVTVEAGKTGDTAVIAEFTNNLATTEVELKATKSINNWGKAEKFKFRLSPADNDSGETSPMPEGLVEGSKYAYATKDPLNLEAAFGSIKYVKAGEYNYTINELIPAGATSENNYTVDGITYDNTTHKVVVTVALDKNGNLQPTVKYDEKETTSVVITNTYDANGKTTLKGAKDIEGRAFKSGDSATMKIEAVTEGAPMPKNETVTVNPSEGTECSFEFEEIKYALSDIPKGAKSATFEYKVTESAYTMEGVAEKDSTEYTVTVTISDNGDGTLKVEKSENAESLNFTNKYDAKGKATLKGAKDIEGRAFKAGDSATMKIEAVTKGAPMPDPATVTINPTGGTSEAFQFADIEYKLSDIPKGAKSATFEYKVTESAYSMQGVGEKDSTEYTVTVTISDNGDGTLKVEKSENAESLNFTNKYDAKGTATLKGAKNITGREFKAGDSATMKIEAVTKGAPMPEPATVTVKPTEGKSEAFQFADIEYKLSDIPEGETSKTFEYKVTESAYSMQGVGEKDSTEYTVTVTISDNGDGTLKVEKSENAESLVFINTYDSKGSVTFSGKKDITGRPFKAGDSATMEIEAVTKGAPLPNPATVTVKPTEGQTAVLEFKPINYTLAMIPEGQTSKTFTYKVTESAYTMEGVAEKDDTEYEVTVKISDNGDGTLKIEKSDTATALNFVNAYDAAGTATLKGAKDIEGRAFKSGDSATMKIEAVTEGAPMPKNDTVTVNPSEGTECSFEFEEIKYALSDIPEGETSKTFEYKVTESAYTMQGVAEKDSTEYTVTVTISDNGDGTLKVEKSENAESLNFTNKYDAKGTATLKGAKDIEGRAFKSGDSATMKIEAVTKGAPLPDPATVTINPTGGTSETFQFADIEYKLSDIPKGAKSATFEYKVTESAYSMQGVGEKDSTEYTVTVTISDNGDGTLKVEKSENAESLNFTNKYDAKGKATLKGAKDIEGRAFKAGDSATMKIEAVTKGAPMPDPATVTINPTGGTSEAFQFADIEYKLSDIPKGAKSATFEYKVTESAYSMQGVGEKDSTEYTVTVTISDNGDGTLKVEKSENAESLNFTNKYDAKGTATLKGAKNITGREFKAGDSATMKIEAVTKGAPMPEPATVTVKPTEGKSEAFQFADIEYKLSDIPEGETSKTFEYKVTESAYSMQGVGEKDSTEYTVTVTISDNGDGTLKVEKSENAESLVFINTYDSKGSVTFSGKKDITGRPFKAGDSATMEIEAVTKGAPLPNPATVTVKPTEGQTAVLEFKPINYTLAMIPEGQTSKTFTYKVTESAYTMEGVAEKDDTEYEVTVKISDNGDGTLKIEKSDTATALNFVNAYDAAGTATLKGAKDIEGRAFKSGDSATMKIEAVTEGAPMPKNDTVTVNPSEGTECSFEFEEIKYALSDIPEGETSKTFEYKVTESAYTMQGVAEKDSTEYTVTVTISDNGDGTLKVEKSENAESLNFTNKYDAKGTATLKGAKDIEGRAFKSGDSATMKIEAVTKGAPLPDPATVTINPTGGTSETFQFADIEYKLSDIPEGETSKTFEYKVTESAYTMQGVAEKDSTEYTVTVTISDNGDGTLKVEKSENAESLNFTNKYDAKGKATLKGAKDIEGRAFKAGDSATMKIEAVTKGAPMPDPATVTVKPTEGKSEAFQFADIEYKLSDIPEGETSKTFEYKVTESAYSMQGVGEKDSTEYTVTVTISDNGDGTLKVEKSENAESLNFTNKYDAKGKATLKGAKNITGREFKAGDSATMKIEAVTKGAPMPEPATVTVKPTEGKSEAFQFADIEYKLSDIPEGETSKTFEYKVTESAYSMQGVGEKDSTEYTVTVTISDNGDGTLKVEKSENAESLNFTNKYAAKGEGEIKVQKLLKGRDWTANDLFTFSISAAEGTPMPGQKSITIRKSDKNQTKSFGKIAFTKAGIYTYKIKESKGSIGGVTYDETEHTVTIKVRDNGKGELVADGCKLVQTEAFTNTYHVAETIGEVMVQKVLDGRKWNDNDEFEFTISAPAGTPMPEERSISITKEDADHIVSFGEIEFTEAGKYNYTIKETKGNEKGMTYDTKAHKVTIEVVDDGNGKLKAKNGTKLIQTVKITNTYRNNRVKTGDDSNMLSYMAIMLGAMLGFVMMLIYRRKHRA